MKTEQDPPTQAIKEFQQILSDGERWHDRALVAEQKLQQADAACAAWRKCAARLEVYAVSYSSHPKRNHQDGLQSTLNEYTRCLNGDFGKGWLSPEKARALTEALRLYHEAWNGEPADWRKAMCEASKNADQALAAVRKP